MKFMEYDGNNIILDLEFFLLKMQFSDIFSTDSSIFCFSMCSGEKKKTELLIIYLRRALLVYLFLTVESRT